MQFQDWLKDGKTIFLLALAVGQLAALWGAKQDAQFWRVRSQAAADLAAARKMTCADMKELGYTDIDLQAFGVYGDAHGWDRDGDGIGCETE